MIGLLPTVRALNPPFGGEQSGVSCSPTFPSWEAALSTRSTHCHWWQSWCCGALKCWR